MDTGVQAIHAATDLDLMLSICVLVATSVVISALVAAANPALQLSVRPRLRLILSFSTFSSMRDVRVFRLALSANSKSGVIGCYCAGASVALESLKWGRGSTVSRLNCLARWLDVPVTACRAKHLQF